MTSPFSHTALLSQAPEALAELFDALPGVLFWVKDAELRITHLNQAFAAWINRPKQELTGCTDADLYFPELAKAFMRDDRRVIETGQPLHRKIELVASRFGEVQWRSTTKLPIRHADGRVIGTTGISMPGPEAGPGAVPRYDVISRIVTYARANVGEGIDVAAIARYAGMSIPSLNRHFRQHLRISPGEFLAQLRVAQACRLLTETSLSILEIGLESGYNNAAAFSRAFRRMIGATPSDWRARTRTGQDASGGGSGREWK